MEQSFILELDLEREGGKRGKDGVRVGGREGWREEAGDIGKKGNKRGGDGWQRRRKKKKS